LPPWFPAILVRASQLDFFHVYAGTYIREDLLNRTPEDWDPMLNLNINAVFRAADAARPHIIERGTGDILVTNSIAGHTAGPWEPNYTASKHTIQAFVHAIRRWFSKHSIRVMEAAPGPVVTALL
jgi:ribitol 2-dehydrogenase